MTQLVVSGNRVLAYGDSCFLSTGGTVVCTVTGRVFQNATVVNDCGPLPSDIDSVGYEYHSGAFVPCAPYGEDNGNGKVMVACEECASPKTTPYTIDHCVWERVWVNDAPAEKFAGQTLTIDGLKGRQFVKIRCLIESSDKYTPHNHEHIEEFLTEEGRETLGYTSHLHSVDGIWYSRQREVTINPTAKTITFGDARYQHNGSSVTDNGSMIPLEIWVISV